MQLTEKIVKKADPLRIALRNLVQKDFTSIDQLLLTELTSEVPLIHEISQHILQSGGKRLRPLILLLSAKGLGYHAKGQEHLELAAIIELIHTATLLHDDVVDASTRRRNQPTANALWGNAASVLAGDFLYSRAFQILARRNRVPVMQLLANTTNRISEGEVLQLMNIGNSELSEENYLKVIRCKTAELYSAASKIGALLAAPENKPLHETAAYYGLHLGMAFQMIDDLLDYTADPKETGKNLGDDLCEGKVTLPLIYTLHHGNQHQQTLVRSAIQQPEKASMEAVVEAILNSHGCAYTRQSAEKEARLAQQALNAFPKNPYQEALLTLCDFVLERRY